MTISFSSPGECSMAILFCSALALKSEQTVANILLTDTRRIFNRGSPASARAINSRSSTRRVAWSVCSTIRSSVSWYSAFVLTFPLSAISDSPRMTVRGVRNSWEISASSFRLFSSTSSRISLLLFKARVRSSTIASRRILESLMVERFSAN